MTNSGHAPASGRPPEPGPSARRLTPFGGRIVRALVVAAAWPPESFPIRLVHSLAEGGAAVTVASDDRHGRRLDGDVERLVLPGPEVSLPSLIWLAARPRLASGSGRSDICRLANRLGTGLGRSGLKDWYRMLPFIGRRWDQLFLAAEDEALSYLPLFQVVAPATVIVERPLLGGRGDRLRPLLESASRVECSSVELSAQALARGADGTRTVVIPPSVDTALFRPPSLPATHGGELQILSSATFHWTAGHDDLLLACRRMVDDSVPVRLHVVSDGADLERLLYTVDDLGLSESVTIHHGVTRQRLTSLLGSADVFVLAAVEERPWPELLEALASGVPVVATDLPSVRSIIDESLGALVPPNNPLALAAACTSLAHDHARRVAAGRAARSRALAMSGAGEP